MKRGDTMTASSPLLRHRQQVRVRQAERERRLGRGVDDEQLRRRSVRRRAVDDRPAIGHEPGVGDRQAVERPGLEAHGPGRGGAAWRIASAPMATPARTAAPRASGSHRRRLAGVTAPGAATGLVPDVDADIASSANAMSRADWNRCDGLFSRQRWMTRSRCGGTPIAPASGGGSVLRIARHPLDRGIAAEGAAGPTSIS